MLLQVLHPEIANRDCKHCWLHQYDESTGKPVLFRGEPLKRYASTPPPCCLRDSEGKSKCLKGSPDDGADLLIKNAIAWRHYRQCKAVGQFPDDLIVRRNAAIIADVENAMERRRDMELSAILKAMVARR